jgi:glycosyltransferase involved in cell wall biosynthesis
MNHSVKLSITLITYNHEKFIADAIESVLNQNLPFNWELIIADDCSIDKTWDIISTYAAKEPTNIKPFRHKVNIGLHKNYEFVRNQAQGEFIAHMEGDDYWIEPDKCKDQIELMEKHPKMSWSFTAGIWVTEKGELIKEDCPDFPEEFNLSYWLCNFVNPLNNTVIYRKSSDINKFPVEFYDIFQWDTFLHYLRAIDGTIGYLPIKSMAWRRHDKAFTDSEYGAGPKRYLGLVKLNTFMYKTVPSDLKHLFDTNHFAYEHLSLLHLNQKSYSRFLYYSLRMFLCRPIRRISEYKDFMWKIRHSLKYNNNRT